MYVMSISPFKVLFSFLLRSDNVNSDLVETSVPVRSTKWAVIGIGITLLVVVNLGLTIAFFIHNSENEESDDRIPATTKRTQSM